MRFPRVSNISDTRMSSDSSTERIVSHPATVKPRMTAATSRERLSI